MFILPFLFSACALIDDDLSVCGEKIVTDYQLQLQTELSLQLQTELVTETEVPVRNALQKWLNPIFTETAKDVDLRFFSTETDELQYRIKEIINDNRKSYTFQLPKDDYIHLGIANIADNNHLRIKEGDHGTTMELDMPSKSELSSLNTGVFTARKLMSIGDTSASFDIHLYMVTCAIAIVIDTTRCDSLVSMRSTIFGAASSFRMYDSLYVYDRDYRVMMDEVEVEMNDPLLAPRRAPGKSLAQYVLMAGSTFPTADNRPWSVEVRTTLTGNRITTTRLTIGQPVQAGTLRILRAHVDGQGGVQPDEGQEVGASVELDWKDGGEHEIDI